MYQLKKNLRWSLLKSGTLITLSLVVVFLAILYAGTLKQIFTPSFEVRAHVRDVKGLRQDAPVWLFGTEVGYVKNIRLDPIYGTIVTMSVDKSVELYIRSDSKAEILTMGLLGDKYVELNPGLPESPPLQQGALLEGSSPGELSGLIEGGRRTIYKIGQLADKADELIEEISHGKGTLSKLIIEPTLYDRLERSAAALESTVEEIQRSRGTLKLMVEDPSLYNRALSAVSSIERITKNLETGQGSLGKFMREPQLYENLNRSAKELDSVLKEMNTGKGMAAAFLRDEDLVRQVKESLADVRAVAEEMKSLLKNIEEHPEKYFKFSIF
jgi:phospholipid/cholesterol/gamma-HCH transport system substrate-binding protein